MSIPQIDEMSIHMSMHRSVRMSIHMSICMSVRMSMRMPIHMSKHVPTCMSKHMPISQTGDMSIFVHSVDIHIYMHVYGHVYAFLCACLHHRSADSPLERLVRGTSFRTQAGTKATSLQTTSTPGGPGHHFIGHNFVGNLAADYPEPRCRTVTRVTVTYVRSWVIYPASAQDL